MYFLRVPTQLLFDWSHCVNCSLERVPMLVVITIQLTYNPPFIRVSAVADRPFVLETNLTFAARSEPKPRRGHACLLTASRTITALYQKVEKIINA